MNESVRVKNQIGKAISHLINFMQIRVTIESHFKNEQHFQNKECAALNETLVSEI